MQYTVRPKTSERSRVPRWPLRPSDNYLRDNMAATLCRQDEGADAGNKEIGAAAHRGELRKIVFFTGGDGHDHHEMGCGIITCGNLCHSARHGKP
jgi:hypothetical protein